MNFIKRILLCFSIFTLCPLSYAECLPNDIQANKIKQSIAKIVTCWNRSDVDCAMRDFYKKDAVYIAKSGPIFGKDNIINYFSDALRDKETGKINLGNLKLDILWCKKIDSTHILILQEYHFKANTNEPVREGYDTLIWEKSNGRWLISYDHPRDK